VARLLAKLKEVAPEENTLIIYASDNGSYRKDRVGNLRGQKGLNWEGGIRVPGIYCWPGVIPAGRVETTPGGVIDTLPTVCGLLGIAPPKDVHLDGSDLAPLLRSGDVTKFTRHQPLFWHLQKSRPIVAMRDGRFSLVAEPDYELSTDNMFQESWIPKIKSGGYVNFQLYDLEADPSQEHDIASSNQEVVERLKKKLLEINASIMADGPDWHLTAKP
ncbi:sulfatase-like hydrolase/transferase, partial [Prosthecobacter sp.]|uniref:sulfatase family protein n=1 Tax=Prosthecobacter sp. TaxID=1965333 RepID=UPI001D88B93C